MDVFQGKDKLLERVLERDYHTDFLPWYVNNEHFVTCTVHSGWGFKLSLLRNRLVVYTY